MQPVSTSAFSFDEYVNQDATGLAALVRTGHVSPAELLETAIARAEDVNPQLNAIVTPLYDKGRAMAADLFRTDKGGTGAFRGVPFLLKDLELEWADTPLKSGCRGYKDYVSKTDSEVVKRLKAAGLVFFGKTNTPEFGLTPYTESKLYGPARNPWNPAHSPGGSSGGSAVAVASGIVPAATASDGGGSIRIPASCCGLFGLKPSRARVTLGPNFSELWGGAVASHVVTRSVRDSAGLLDAVAGSLAGDPYGIAAPQRPFAEEVGREPGKLRIAFSTQALMEAQPTDPECVKAVRDTATLLESLGHMVEEVPLPYEKTIVTKAFFLSVLSETAAALREMGEYLGRPVRRDDVELNTWALTRMAAGYPAADAAYQKRRWNTLNRSMGQLHETYDLFLTPTLPRPPIVTGAFQNTAAEERALKLVDAVGGLKYLKGSKLVDDLAEKSLGYISYTVITNMTGQPSMTVPLHWSAAGLPIGVMFAAKLGDEATLFRLAGQLEQVQPWFDKRPAL